MSSLFEIATVNEQNAGGFVYIINGWFRYLYGIETRKGGGEIICYVIYKYILNYIYYLLYILFGLTFIILYLFIYVTYPCMDLCLKLTFLLLKILLS